MKNKGSSFSGLRAVALFEGSRALLPLIVGFGLLGLINQDASAVAEHLIRQIHLNPFAHYPRIFIEAARSVTNTKLCVFAFLAALDALLRCGVAYGLWHNQRWAKWLGVAAAGIYVPLEIYGIIHRPTILKVVTLVINLLIVAFLGYSLRSENSEKAIT